MDRLKAIAQWVILAVIALAIVAYAVVWMMQTRAMAVQGSQAYSALMRQAQQQRQAAPPAQ